ncbi:MAG TPA: hypothetical protein VMN56_13505 [Casimicrobiaceae bacterium]|nr:hypothetical protein [Casimicrobiaceae bacterium]
MDTFAPEFSKFWLAEGKTAAADAGRRGDEDASKLKAALEELADLVSAARSIV